MKKYTVFILFCFVLYACSPTNKNKIEISHNSHPSPKNLKIDKDSFPTSWLGNWEGDLNIFKDNKIVQTIPMELEMLEIDTSNNFVWAIIYGEDKIAGRRAYELETLNASKGQYRVDEKNSIKLESYLFQNKLLSWYEVMGNQILCIYEKQGDKMIFEIIFGNSEPVSITGDKKVDGEDIPAVRTFPIGGYQRAILSRK